MPTLDFVAMIEALQGLVSVDGPFWILVTTVCWFAAMLFLVTSLIQFTQVGDNRGVTMKTPAMSLVAAIFMASSPELLASLTVTTFGSNASPLAYVQGGEQTVSFRAVMTLIAFIGYCFFVRGIWILKESGEPQRYRDATLSKALITMFAGMAAVHADMVLQVAGNTFGWDMSAYIQ